jgi:preprotein translocase subunit SecG
MQDVLSPVLSVMLLLIAVALVGIIVVQRNDGGLGGLGGGSGSGGMGGLMSGRGASNFLTKTTRWLAVAFFATTLALAWLTAHRGEPTSLTTPTAQPEAPAGTAGAPAAGGDGAAAPATEAPAGGGEPAAPTTSQ